MGTIALVLLSAVPGYLLTSRDLPAGTSAPERWAFALGLGFWSVTFLGSVVWLLPIHRLGLWHPPVVVAACSLLVSLLAWRRWRRLPVVQAPGPVKSDWLVFGLTAAVFALFFFGVDDEHFTAGCLYRSLDFLAKRSPYEDLPILRVNGDERFGNVAAVWTIRTLCPGAFERTGQAFFAALLFLSSAALGRRLTGRNWPGVAAALALVLTDDVFGFEILNQNLIAAFTATVLALLSLQEHHPSRGAFVTFLAAMLVSSRYITVFGVGAWLAVAAKGNGFRSVRWNRLLSLAAAGLVFLAPTFVLIATGGGRPDEILPYRVLVVPFVDDLTRTPMLPFPMWIGWPLHFLGTWGWLGATLVVSGWVFLWRERRRPAVLLGLYAVPVALFLLAQENWIEPEKMTIGLIFAPVAVAGISVALDRASRARDRAVPVTMAAASLAVAVVWLGAREWLPQLSFPEEPRVREFYPGLPSETPDLLAFERERVLAWRFLPAPRSQGVLRSPARKARQVGRALGFLPDPGREFSVRELSVKFLDETILNRPRVEAAMAPPTGNPVVATHAWTLDLTTRPLLAPRPMGSGEPRGHVAPVLDLSDGRECAMTAVEGVRVQYLDRTVRVLVCVRDDEAFVFVAPPRVPTLEPGDEPPSDVPASWIFAKNPDIEHMPVVDRLVLKLPERVARVTLVDVLYVEPTRYYARAGDVGPDGSIDLGRPWFWHAN